MEHVHDHPEATARDYFIFTGIILAILAGTLALNAVSSEPGWFTGMRYFEGLFFLTFAAFKLVRYRDFVDAYQGYDVVAKRWVGWAKVYPFIELALAAGFLFNVALVWVLAATFVLMTVGAIGVVQELRRGSHITCACLGTVIKLPLTHVTLVEDVAMGAMAAYMLSELVS